MWKSKVVRQPAWIQVVRKDNHRRVSIPLNKIECVEECDDKSCRIILASREIDCVTEYKAVVEAITEIENENE